MTTDSQLLRAYRDEHSEPAFTQLVQRHLSLVYSVAVRRVGGDAQLAQDVAQKVFSDLARKAATLTDRPTLAGWLYASAHVASAAIVRGEQRRKARESEAHFMQTTFASPESEADWNQFRPVLDDVIVALKDEEREVIALRFFEQRSLAHVGSALQISEDAARKRVDRALDKLRSALGRRGVTSTAAALGITLTAMSSVPVPDAVATNIASYAMAHAGVQNGTSLIATLARALWPSAAVVIVGGVLLNSQRQTNEELLSDVAQLTAENQEMAAIRAENRQLALDLVQREKTTPASSVPESAPAPAPTAPPPLPVFSAVISLSPQGTLRWNQDPVKLEGFVERLRQQAAIDPQARINIRNGGAKPSQLAYVIDEARKARLEHVTIDDDVPLASR